MNRSHCHWHWHWRALALAGVAAAALNIAPAHAQTDATAPADILITAQKRIERLQDVPVSVTALPAPDLAAQGIVRFSDYASRVPGLSLTSVRTGQAQVTLRGITTGVTQSASATGFYIDEAPIGSVNAYAGGSSTTPDLDPSDLRQIEILKGPQGTLYGAGAVGGLVKFTTTPTDLSDASASLSGGVNSVAQGDVGYALRGMLNLPLATDRLALRVSGFTRRDAGAIDNVNARIGRENINRATVRGGRAVLSARFGEDVRLDISAIAQDTRTTGLNTVDVDAVTLAPIHGHLAQDRQLRESGRVQFRLYNATWRADLGRFDLLSSTTYQHTRFHNVTDISRGFGVALGGIGLRSTQNTRTERWSQELRLSSDGLASGLLDVQAGLYWTQEKASNRIPGFDPFDIATGAPLPLPNLVTASILSEYREVSAFGNARVHFTAQFDILAGLRYSHDDQDYFQDYRGRIIGPRRTHEGQETADIVTWMVSPRFRFSPDFMLYARAASGYRPGGPNAVPPPSVFVAPDTFDPDRLTQMEVGFKGAALNGALDIEAAAFHTRWKAVQMQTSAAGFNFIVNGGRAKSQGGELMLRYRPIDGLTLASNLAYTDARLTSDAPAGGGVDGDRLPYVPRWSGSVMADQLVPIGNDMHASFGAGINFVSARISDYSRRFPKRLGGYATFDLRAGITRGNWSLSAFAKNLTDRRAITVATSAGLGPNNRPGAVYLAAYNQPRMIGAEASLAF
jgi:iron complex outermembrane receptor protein